MKSSTKLFAALIVCSGLSANAAEIRLGEVLSAGFAQTRLGDLPSGFETGYQGRWGAGVALELTWGRHSALLLSPGYLKKGGTLSDPSGEPESKYDFGYLEVPLEFRYAFGEHSVRPYLLAGTSVGFLLTAKLRPGTRPETDMEDVTRGVDVSLLAGVGLQVPGRWGRGFFDIVLLEGVRDINALGTMEIRQRSILVRAGWTFGLKRHGQAGADAASGGR